MLRKQLFWKVTSYSMLFLALGTLMAADGDHADRPSDTPTATGSARADGDADKAFKDKAVEFFGKIFTSVPESYLKETTAPKLSDALTKAKEGNSQPMSDALTPLFGTLNNAQFDKLMKDVEDKIKAEKATDKTVDNKFIDLLEEVQKYGKVIQGIPDETTDKNKAEAALFKKDFEAQQKKNTDFLAKVDEIKKLKPEDKDKRAALQKDLLGNINQKAALAFINDQVKTGSDANKQVARDLRAALATKTDSGHAVIDTVWNGQTERIIWDPKDATAGDEAIAGYAAERGNFKSTSLAPSLHANPTTSWTLSNEKDANGKRKVIKGTPTGFKPPVVAQPQPAQPATGGAAGTGAQPTGGQPSGGAGPSADKVNEAKGIISAKCTRCHGTDIVNGKLAVKGKATTASAGESISDMAGVQGDLAKIKALGF